MQLDLSGHHVEVTESLRAYVLKKFERISRHFEQLIDVHCVLTVEKRAAQGRGHADAARKQDPRRATEDNMYAAIDALTDKLDRSVKKHKEKAADHHAEDVIKARLSGLRRPRVDAAHHRERALGLGQERRSAHAGGHRLLLCRQYPGGAAQALHLPHRPRHGRHLSQNRGRAGCAQSANEIETIPALVGELRRSGINCEVLYLHASDEVLLKRYAETRRKHPW